MWHAASARVCTMIDGWMQRSGVPGAWACWSWCPVSGNLGDSGRVRRCAHFFHGYDFLRESAHHFTRQGGHLFAWSATHSNADRRLGGAWRAQQTIESSGWCRLQQKPSNSSPQHSCTSCTKANAREPGLVRAGAACCCFFSSCLAAAPRFATGCSFATWLPRGTRERVGGRPHERAPPRTSAPNALTAVPPGFSSSIAPADLGRSRDD